MGRTHNSHKRGRCSLCKGLSIFHRVDIKKTHLGRAVSIIKGFAFVNTFTFLSFFFFLLSMY